MVRGLITGTRYSRQQRSTCCVFFCQSGLLRSFCSNSRCTQSIKISDILSSLDQVNDTRWCWSEPLGRVPMQSRPRSHLWHLEALRPPSLNSPSPSPSSHYLASFMGAETNFLCDADTNMAHSNQMPKLNCMLILFSMTTSHLRFVQVTISTLSQTWHQEVTTVELGTTSCGQPIKMWESLPSAVRYDYLTVSASTLRYLILCGIMRVFPSWQANDSTIVLDPVVYGTSGSWAINIWMKPGGTYGSNFQYMFSHAQNKLYQTGWESNQVLVPIQILFKCGRGAE